MLKVARTRRGAPAAAETGPVTADPGVSWGHVLPLAVVLAYANGFWLEVLRGAVGSTERTSRPFATWLLESALLTPAYIAAVLAAFWLLSRRYGARPRGARQVAVVIVTMAAAGAVTGTMLIAGSALIDYRLQVESLFHTSQTHASCLDPCLQDRLAATGRLQVRSIVVGLGLLLLTDLVLVAMTYAYRGGVIVLHRSGRRVALGWLSGPRLLVVVALVGAALVHAAVVPEHLEEWRIAGAFFVVLVWAQLGAAYLVAGRTPGWVRNGLIATVLVSVGPLLVWGLSRTMGVPWGPEALEPERIGVADVASGILELLALVVAVSLLRARRARRAWTLHARAVAVAAAVAVTVIGVGGSSLPGVGAFSQLGHEHVEDDVGSDT